LYDDDEMSPSPRIPGFSALGLAAVVLGFTVAVAGCGSDTGKPFGDDGQGGSGGGVGGQPGAGGGPAPGTGGTMAVGSGGLGVGTGGADVGTGGHLATGGFGVAGHLGTAGAGVGGNPTTGTGGHGPGSGTGGAAAGTGGGGAPGGHAGATGVGGGAGGTGGSGGPGGTGGTGGQGGPGGTGGNIGTTCDDIATAYSNEIPNAKACSTADPGACGIKVSRSLGCLSGCSTFVDDDTQLKIISDRWKNTGCDKLPRACPAIACLAVTGAVCKPSAAGGGAGLCTDSSALVSNPTTQ
jgi:hypothetical protein